MDEVSKGRFDRLIWALPNNLAGFPDAPDDRVRVEVRQALSRGQGSCVCALSRARVAKDENFHAAQREWSELGSRDMDGKAREGE